MPSDAPSTIEVRPARREDAPAWRPLWDAYCDFYETAVPDAVTMHTWERILDPGSDVECLVVLDDGHMVGFAAYVLHDGTWSDRLICYLEDLFVAEKARGKGAAKALLDALIERGRRRGWAKVYLMTKAGNARARAFYEKYAPVTDWVRYDFPLD